MWSISNLKNRGKKAFRRNYWKCVLVGLLLSVIVGGFAGSGAANSADEASDESTISQFEYHPGNRYEIEGGEFYFDDESGSWGFDMDQPNETQDLDIASLFSNPFARIGLMFGTGMIVVFTVFALVIAILIDMFLYNPLELGSKRFFFINQKENAEVKEVAYGYDHGWKNVGVTLFFRDLYTFLWALLLIIPGIVKAYEYRMMPYILAENPEMPKEEVFALSKKLMHGEKWHTFVMDLSFIGWHILGVLTLGIVEVFWTIPYQSSTNATLYEALKYLKIESVQKMYEEEFSAEASKNEGFDDDRFDE
ncbi:MAG: DUF975 family protein [Lachnospiraceae bacterium]|nr:DUF975 family protein [Lachnospiraceae bacterium]